jgi:hypothetical protein
MQDISLQQEREVPCGKRCDHMHSDRIAVVDRGCTTGIAGGRAAGAEKVRDQNISVCRNLDSDPVAGLSINVIPDAHEVLDCRSGGGSRGRGIGRRGNRCISGKRGRGIGRCGNRCVGGRRGRCRRIGRCGCR